MNELDKRFMEEALAEARLALEEGEVPVGAVIVYKGNIIGRGHNSREGHQDISGHAEINALKEAAKTLGRWSMEGCTLYVTLEPCLMCGGAIKQSRLTSLVYGASDEQEGALSVYHVFDADNGAQTIHNGVCDAECQRILQQFFLQRRDKSR